MTENTEKQAEKKANNVRDVALLLTEEMRGEMARRRELLSRHFARRRIIYLDRGVCTETIDAYDHLNKAVISAVARGEDSVDVAFDLAGLHYTDPKREGSKEVVRQAAGLLREDSFSVAPYDWENSVLQTEQENSQKITIEIKRLCQMKLLVFWSEPNEQKPGG